VSLIPIVGRLSRIPLVRGVRWPETQVETDGPGAEEQPGSLITRRDVRRRALSADPYPAPGCDASQARGFMQPSGPVGGDRDNTDSLRPITPSARRARVLRNAQPTPRALPQGGRGNPGHGPLARGRG
jgi:hypothetical protein